MAGVKAKAHVVVADRIPHPGPRRAATAPR
jgi:hypothetical protein